MKFATYIANLLFSLLNKRRYTSFCGNADKIGTIQQKLLFDILKENNDTRFGIDHQFSAIKDIETFRKSVPLSDYESYKAYIEKIMKGETAVLTSSEVGNLVPTSGTNSASKYIPYTKSLKTDFSKQVNVWISNLFTHYKKLKHYKQFWIVSPASKPENHKSKVPIGFEDDSAYLGFVGRKLVKQVLIVPDEISQIKSISNYYFTICYLLLAEKQIGLISVWNPSMLIEMIKYISDNFPKIVEAIKTGIPALPDNNANDETIAKRIFRKDTKRARELENTGIDCLKIWPNLQVISCWTDAWAKLYLEEVKRLFPGIPVQGKGLLATEGIVSIPFVELDYPLLTYDSHFYEFIEIESQKLFLADELEKDKRYEVIITTNGGLYRYNMYDIVEVKGFYKGVPMLEFIGRSNRVSDFTGEKLNEIHVTEILDNLIKKHCITNGSFFLKAVIENHKTYYGLFADESILKKGYSPEIILDELETELCKNYHYYNSRMMKQLGRPKLFCLPAHSLNEQINKTDNQMSTKKEIRLVIPQ